MNSPADVPCLAKRPVCRWRSYASLSTLAREETRTSESTLAQCKIGPGLLFHAAELFFADVLVHGRLLS